MDTIPDNVRQEGYITMTIQPLGGAGAALYITASDLRQRGLTPGGLTLEEALTLTREAFARQGIQQEGAIEIEAYPDAQGVLVFARVRPASVQWYSFSGLEEVLAAARGLGSCAPEGTLLRWEERYWLSVPSGAEQAVNRLSEFGRRETLHPNREARLREHGAAVLTGRPVTALLEHFPV
jgi:negative regulator of genetic competence, sporulation and motility